MKRYLIPIVAILLTGCLNSSEKKARFTKEQIRSLHLNSTVILSTNKDSVENVVLNPFLEQQDFDLGSKLTNLDIIPLETTDDGLLDVIYKVLITKSHIYVYDRLKGGGLVVFSKDGKFIKRMAYGQGPGEINRLYDIAFDSKNNKLIAYQHSYLNYYTDAGEFIEQKRLPFGFYNFKSIPNGYVFKALDAQGNEHLGPLKNNTLIITDTAFKIKSVGLPYPENVVSFGGYNYLYGDNQLSITQRFVDTVYNYDSQKNKLSARYALSYQSKELPKEYIQGQMTAFEKATKQNDYYYYIGEYLETNRQNVFFLMNNYHGQKTIIYRDKKSKHLIGGTRTLYGNKKEIPGLSFPIAVDEGKFVSVHYVNKKDPSLLNSSLLSAEAKQKLEKLTDDDNPVLVLFKLKDF